MSRVGREISYLKRSRVVQASNGRKRTRRKGCGYREEAARKKEKGAKKGKKKSAEEKKNKKRKKELTRRVGNGSINRHSRDGAGSLKTEQQTSISKKEEKGARSFLADKSRDRSDGEFDPGSG